MRKDGCQRGCASDEAKRAKEELEALKKERKQGRVFEDTLKEYPVLSRYRAEVEEFLEDFFETNANDINAVMEQMNEHVGD